LDYVEVSLMDLVCEVIREQSPLAAFKNVQLKQEVDVTLPLVQLDPELMNRVFQNLIDNALKFTPQGGLIQISARAGRPEDQRKVQLSEPFICIKVSDNGPGIPEETRERLFDKFVTGKHRQTGSGLGLTFCKLAVEAHGGEIYVESEPDQGTDFVLTIPYQMPEHASS
jgi:signal transduction histidine kinase